MLGRTNPAAQAAGSSHLPIGIPRLGEHGRIAPLSMPWMIRWLVVADFCFAIGYLISTLVFRHAPATVAMPAGAGSTAPVVEWKFQWLSRLLDLNAEQNLPTWYSSAKLLLIAVLFAVMAWAVWNRRPSPAAAAAPAASRSGVYGLAAAACLCLFMSADETAVIHENVGGKLVHVLSAHRHDPVVVLAAFWMLVTIPFTLLLWRIARSTAEFWRGRPAIARKFAIGIAVYLVSAAGSELAYAIIFGAGAWPPIQILIEETGEMIGATIVLWAAWDLLRVHGVRLTVAE